MPVGNGALIAGIGTWLRADGTGHAGDRRPGRGRAGDDAVVAQRRPSRRRERDTVADGIAARVPVPEALKIMRASCDEMALVDDVDILDAQRELAVALPFTIEPPAAAAWAAMRTPPPEGGRSASS